MFCVLSSYFDFLEYLRQLVSAFTPICMNQFRMVLKNFWIYDEMLDKLNEFSFI